MQEVRKVAACWMFIGVTASLMLSSIACTSAKGDDNLLTKIQNADQILLVTPEKVVNVAGGERFQVKVDRVLRGKSKPGTLLSIVQSGNAKEHPKFEAKQQYLFFLKKPAEPTGGWGYTGVETFPVKSGKLTLATEDNKTEEVAISDLVKLIAENPPSEERVADRQSLTGRWFVVVSQSGSDMWWWLVEIGTAPANGGAVPVKQLAASQMFAASTLASSKVTGNTVELVFNAEGEVFRFEGTLAGGTAKGALTAAGSGLIPARLIATENANLEGFAEPRDSIGKEEFVEAMGTEKPEALREFIKKYPDGPLTLDAYTTLAGMLANEKAPQAEYEKLAVEFQKAAVPWGPFLQIRVDLDLGVTLLRRNHLNELGLKYLDAGEQKFTKTMPAFLRGLVRKERGRGLLAIGKAADGIALLEKIHQESPFDGEVTYLLAEQAEAAKKTDAALAMYAELSALPSLEPQLAQTFRSRGEKDFQEKLPSARLKKLWEAKHGNTSGLEKYLSQVVDERTRKLVKAAVPPRKAGEGTRVALLELFTGGSCPPCVGADMGISALEATYQQSELIVLRYHEHIPRPDPLANAASAARMEVYRPQGTPAIFLNGKQYNMAGPLAIAPMIYEALKQAIDPILNEKVATQVLLSAKAEPGGVQITASAAGMKSFPKNLHLMLVIAESRIESKSDNGIRVHEMVVRAIPSRAGGVPPENGQFKVSFRLPIGEVRKMLGQYLAEAEKEMQQPFREKPLALKDLKLVGFLQNQETGEVSQAAVISLPEELPAPAASAPGTSAKGSPAKSAPGK